MSFFRKTLLFLGYTSATLVLSTQSCLAADGVSPSAYELIKLGGFPVTNAMVTTWVMALGLIIVIRLAVGGKPQLVPTRSQAIVESVVEGVRSTMEPIVGKRMIGPTFPLLLCLFVYILIHNWSGLLPGVGTFGHYDEHGHLLYYFRPATSDLNTTLALAVISFTTWVYFIFRYEGIKSVMFHIFGNKADRKEVSFIIYFLLFFIFFGVGLIECISILFRLVSLSFRLYGNVFGGENLLTSMHGLFKYILPVPFYFLEVLIGLIQAFVFTLLTAVYIGLMCNHDGEEHAH